MHESDQGSWVSIARESFEHGVVPWAGRDYAGWVRAWGRPRASDPSGLVELPETIYRAFQQRVPGQRLTKQQAKQLGYPSVPGERELDQVRRELHEALGRCDWDQAHDLDTRLRDLQERVAAMRLSALRPALVR
jgi:hypothetical protein